MLQDYLFHLYKTGHPMVGLWGGMSNADICQTLSPRTDSRMWHRHPEECEDLIWNHFQSVYVVVQAILIAALGYVVISTAWNALFYCLVRLVCPSPRQYSQPYPRYTPRYLTSDTPGHTMLVDTSHTPVMHLVRSSLPKTPYARTPITRRI